MRIVAFCAIAALAAGLSACATNPETADTGYTTTAAAEAPPPPPPVYDQPPPPPPPVYAPPPSDPARSGERGRSDISSA
jgi:hypothetical protein